MVDEKVAFCSPFCASQIQVRCGVGGDEDWVGGGSFFSPTSMASLRGGGVLDCCPLFLLSLTRDVIQLVLTMICWFEGAGSALKSEQ